MLLIPDFDEYFFCLCFRLTKPATFADCVGNELPIGWEQAYDPLIGVYYIDHNNREYGIRLE